MLGSHPGLHFGGQGIADMHAMHPHVATLPVRGRQMDAQAVTAAAATVAATGATEEVAETPAPQVGYVPALYEPGRRRTGRNDTENEAECASRAATWAGASSTTPRTSTQPGPGGQSCRVPAAGTRPACTARGRIEMQRVSYETGKLDR